MFWSRLHSYSLLLLVAALSCATAQSGRQTAGRSATAASSGEWRQYADVRQVGFDEQALRGVCERANSLRSGALMAVFRGRIILACGDVGRKFEAYSVRKSLVSGLYGTAVARGEINLDSTLADLAIDEKTPLTSVELSATIRQVISARSGVYLPAAYGASQDRRRPGRGSHLPGTQWFYNNWDFNIAGVVYEKATREDLFRSFSRRLAQPLGMEDWNPADGFRAYEPTKSLHPAHTFRISTRDLARFGQLYLQQGQWADRQILSADWVTESTRPHTDDGDGTGYGYMWWTYQAGSSFTAQYPNLGKHTFYRALGSGEQGLWVIPGADLVVVHRADTDHSRTVASEDHWALVESIVAARRTEPMPKPALQPLQPTALSTQLPPLAIPAHRRLDENALNQYLGEYDLAPGPTNFGAYKLSRESAVRVFLFNNNPYIHLPGVGDVQIFPAVQRDTFNVRVALSMTVGFERGTDGQVATVTLAMGEYLLRASKSQRP